MSASLDAICAPNFSAIFASKSLLISTARAAFFCSSSPTLRLSAEFSSSSISAAILLSRAFVAPALADAPMAAVRLSAAAAALETSMASCFMSAVRATSSNCACFAWLSDAPLVSFSLPCARSNSTTATRDLLTAMPNCSQLADSASSFAFSEPSSFMRVANESLSLSAALFGPFCGVLSFLIWATRASWSP